MDGVESWTQVYVKEFSENEFRQAIIDYRYNGQIVIKNLIASSIYDIRISDGNLVCNQRVATKSNSTGVIKHFFNHEVLAGDENSLVPDGTSFSEVEKELKNLIKSAKTSIDYCAYNTSVTSIVNALIDASARGVKVRVIAESDNTNSALDNALPFNVFYDEKDALMHNKFIIVDATSEDNAHVVMGSMNFTTNQMTVDPNHLMFIQDKTLAQAYTIEFEEMWGSNTATPNRANSKFGEAKEDNTPHIFTINDKRVESYFSPTDRTATRIRSKLSTANDKINSGLLLLTHDLLIEELKYQGSIGIEVNVLLDDDDDGILDDLRSKNVNAFKDQSSTIFHYKTGVVDGKSEMSDPILITGSHNWTYSAETRNDENTIIIHDYEIANLYDRALDYWWDKWMLSENEELETFEDEFIFKNDNNSINGKNISNKRYNEVVMINSFGIILESAKIDAQNEFSIDIHTLAPGIYFINIKSLNQNLTKPFIKL